MCETDYRDSEQGQISRSHKTEFGLRIWLEILWSALVTILWVRNL